MRFDSYHPAINLIYFAAVIAMTIAFTQPVFLLIGYVCAFIYSVKLKGLRALIFDLALIPIIALWAMFYAYYNHFGITELFLNVIGNTITLESLVYGIVIGIRAAGAAMWMSCVHEIMTTDKTAYLLGRVCPKLSLYFCMILRMIPRVKGQYQKMKLARSCIGCGRRSVLSRMGEFFKKLSAVLTWLFDALGQTADSMKSRGYTLKGRTAFSIYRFDNRDRSFVISLFFCIIAVLMGAMLSQTSALYSPEIVINRITPLSYAFYIAYAVMCLMPMGLQIAGEVSFERRVVRV